MTTDSRVDLSTYVVISVWFGCNNDCITCMLSGMREQLPPIGFENFKRVLLNIRKGGRYKSLILSGAEVTTFDDLDRYIRFAASLGWFEKIQIQTNGRRLSNKGYLQRLIDQGVNEFFVSIYGTEDVHDAITRKKGSHRETMQGIRNLESFEANVISNTVLSKANFYDIPRLMAFLSEERISEVHLWNFFPMERSDTGDLLVSMKDFLGLLPELLAIIRPKGKPLVLKSFPECLAIEEPAVFDNYFPETVLPDRFWRKFAECGFGTCIYRDRCKSLSCWGLSRAYIHKYGDEKELLSPLLGED
jgi:MoaA/NifB/PqqE/SkfB family radical SAM enzyme